MVEDLIKAINHFIIVFSFRGKRKLKTKKIYRSGTYKYQWNTFFFNQKRKMVKDWMNHIIRVFSERTKRKKKKENQNNSVRHI